MLLAKVLLGELFSVFSLPEQALAMTRSSLPLCLCCLLGSPVYGGLFGFLSLSKGGVKSVSAEAVKEKKP